MPPLFFLVMVNNTGTIMAIMAIVSITVCQKSRLPKTANEYSHSDGMPVIGVLPQWEF
jgi:hypothetical protein